MDLFSLLLWLDATPLVSGALTVIAGNALDATNRPLEIPVSGCFPWLTRPEAARFGPVRQRARKVAEHLSVRGRIRDTT